VGKSPEISVISRSDPDLLLLLPPAPPLPLLLLLLFGSSVMTARRGCSADGMAPSVRVSKLRLMLSLWHTNSCRQRVTMHADVLAVCKTRCSCSACVQVEADALAVAHKQLRADMGRCTHKTLKLHRTAHAASLRVSRLRLMLSLWHTNSCRHRWRHAGHRSTSGGRTAYISRAARSVSIAHRSKPQAAA
jgi:hypothetical protein